MIRIHEELSRKYAEDVLKLRYRNNNHATNLDDETKERLNKKIANAIAINAALHEDRTNLEDHSMMINDVNNDNKFMNEYKYAKANLRNKTQNKQCQRQNAPHSTRSIILNISLIIYNCKGLENNWEFTANLIINNDIGFLFVNRD